jgi:hypothetical protein
VRRPQINNSLLSTYAGNARYGLLKSLRQSRIFLAASHHVAHWQERLVGRDHAHLRDLPLWLRGMEFALGDVGRVRTLLGRGTNAGGV